MAIRLVTPSGLKIEVDNEEDLELAIRVAERSRSIDSAATYEAEAEEETAPSDPWGEFWSGLSDEAKGVLAFWKERGRATLDETREKLGLEKNVHVAGVVSGIVKASKRAGIEPRSLFIRTEEGKRSQRVVIYQAGPLLEETNLDE